MFKNNNVILQLAEERHLPFLVKWGNVGGLKGQFSSKRRTNIFEQNKRLELLTHSAEEELFVVNIKNIDQPVGVCEIYKINYIDRTCFINLYLEDKEQILGVHGFAILKLVLTYLFYRLGLHKVSVDLLLENSIDISLFKQLDFKVEVRKRRHAFIKGSYKTVLELGLQKHEFDKKYHL